MSRRSASPQCAVPGVGRTHRSLSPSMRGHEVSFSRFGSHRRTGGELTGRAATTPNLDVLRFASSPNHDRGRPEPARPSPIRSAVSCPSATSAPRRPHTTAGKGGAMLVQAQPAWPPQPPVDQQRRPGPHKQADDQCPQPHRHRCGDRPLGAAMSASAPSRQLSPRPERGRVPRRLEGPAEPASARPDTPL